MNTLELFFDWLLQASLRASVLTLLVFVIQWVLQRLLSPRWRYALWLPVLIVLLTPVLPESRWSIENVFQAEPTTVKTHPGSVVAEVAHVSVPSNIQSFVSPPTPVDWRQIYLVTWALGALLLLLVGGFSFLRTLLRFQRSRQSISEDLLSQLHEISREIGLRCSPRVLVAPMIQSPAVTGLLRPTLLLPAGFERDFTAEEARLILQHEMTHLKRHDLPLNTLLCVLMAVHWFNPLLWLAFFKARTDREAACDAQVLANATPQRRSEYGHALLKIESAFSPLRLSLGFVGMTQRGSALRARIRSIAVPTRTRPLSGLFATLCISGMTFLGITRAEKSAAATDDDTSLIAIEIETVRFQQDTTWDFGGRLKQVDPTNDQQAGGQIEMLGEKDFRALQEQLRQQVGADIAAYPRMVTKDGKEVMIRSVVNQPVVGGKNDNGRDLVTYLPIGFIGKFTPKVTQGGMVMLDVDITNSNLLTQDAQPVASSRVYRGPVELKPGITVAQYAWQGHGWKDGKPQSYRPTVTFITAHVIDAKEGGLPADEPNDFAIGHSSFLPGDSIRITQVQRGDDFMTVTADYELASADTARISLFITSKDKGRTKAETSQTKTIAKGRGSVILHHPDVEEGMPHVSFYPDSGGKSFGGIYFGTPEEAAQSRKYRIKDMSGAAKSAGGSNEITLNLPDAPVETVISIYEKLKGKKVSVEPAAKDNRVRIIAPEPLPPQEATAFIEATLLLNGFALVADGPDNLTLRKSDTPQPSVIETKLRNIIFPKVQFSGATMDEALAFLRAKSRALDTSEPNEAKRGVNFILQGASASTVLISLDLTNVPLSEVVKYTADLAGMSYRVEEAAVVFLSRSNDSAAKPATPIQGKAVELAKKYILPQVQFSGATIEEAVEFLRVYPRDREGAPSPWINFILKPGGDPKAKISLDLKDVPVWEALRYIAELSNHTLSADDHTIILTPR